MDRLYGTALRLTGNPDDAQDVVAEAVSKAWSKLDDLRDLESMEGWLFRILNNAFVSQWRRRRTRDEVEREAVETSDAGDFSLFQQLHQPFQGVPGALGAHLHRIALFKIPDVALQAEVLRLAADGLAMTPLRWAFWIRTHGLRL